MPRQQFQILRCHSCETFQVFIIKTKNVKWQCKLCNMKQSVKHAYNTSSSAQECRVQVQKLNNMRRILSDLECDKIMVHQEQEQQPVIQQRTDEEAQSSSSSYIHQKSLGNMNEADKVQQLQQQHTITTSNNLFGDFHDKNEFHYSAEMSLLRKRKYEKNSVTSSSRLYCNTITDSQLDHCPIPVGKAAISEVSPEVKSDSIKSANSSSLQQSSKWSKYMTAHNDDEEAYSE